LATRGTGSPLTKERSGVLGSHGIFGVQVRMPQASASAREAIDDRHTQVLIQNVHVLLLVAVPWGAFAAVATKR
jgi:hypothetical protein